ncbi:MAG: class I SAM-dependent methyltransferase [Prevotellaceae bacterium]|jgi:SAM-dependent methyltransferase|nr:class I SAM-dependent methyltransferase [Prevotellaceae bacterium]
MQLYNKVKYIHSEEAHNMMAPSIVVPIVLDVLARITPPLTLKSVVDFGCGLGTWLKAFKNNGVNEVLGLDGKWYNPKLLFKYIDEKEFRCVDLEQPMRKILRVHYDYSIEYKVKP